MRNEPFFIVIYHSSLVKGAMNDVRVCKLRVLKKPLNFFFFQWPKVDQVRNEYLSFCTCADSFKKFFLVDEKIRLNVLACSFDITY